MWRLTVAIAAVVALVHGNATAQNLSERTITLVNPYAAGGPADLLARTVAARRGADDAEAGYPDVEMSTWYGISAPAGMPRAVIDRLYAAIAQTLASDGVKQKLSAQGAEIFLKEPDAFAAYMRADATRMRALIESTNMKSEAE